MAIVGIDDRMFANYDTAGEGLTPTKVALESALTNANVKVRY